jgi:hypothetical protein
MDIFDKLIKSRVVAIFRGDYRAHGGADPVMLERLLSPTPPSGPFSRPASHIDGAASILLGIVANRPLETRQAITIKDKFDLSSKKSQDKEKI